MKKPRLITEAWANAFACFFICRMSTFLTGDVYKAFETVQGYIVSAL